MSPYPHEALRVCFVPRAALKVLDVRPQLHRAEHLNRPRGQRGQRKQVVLQDQSQEERPGRHHDGAVREQPSPEVTYGVEGGEAEDGRAKRGVFRRRDHNVVGHSSRES